METKKEYIKAKTDIETERNHRQREREGKAEIKRRGRLRQREMLDCMSLFKSSR